MDLDQSFMSELPPQHRQKVCRQVRQKQIEKYVAFITSERGREPEPRRQNKRRVNVTFSTNLLLQAAVDEFDDLQVSRYLNEGGDPNFTTGNGTTMLHKCAAEDNASAAELLISAGADVNVRDDDWWTPLHTACSCDSVEITQLLIDNGASIEAIDVDGYFPVDQASEGSESRAICIRHLEAQGMTEEMLQKGRLVRPREMLNHIKALPLAVDINQLTSEGMTLLHIAAANGYRSCLKALFKYELDVNKKDAYGWTPLHVAARFNQKKSVELLLKRHANPNIADSLGCKPSTYTSSDELKALLVKCERKFVEKRDVPDTVETHSSDEELFGRGESVYEEIAGGSRNIGNEDLPPPPPEAMLFRINSKIMRARHVTISKEDELQEARAMYEAVADCTSGHADKPGKGQQKHPKKTDEDSDYYSMAIWKSGSSKKGKLKTCSNTDNLTALSSISEEGILKELERRYSAAQIYTYIGDVLVAVNPFKDLEYYSREISSKYHEKPKSDDQLPPHVYGIAENSYRALRHAGGSQCHVISGESGSGKTETCKYIVQHLLRVAGSEETHLNTKINQVNPLLEAFGNAVTLMNNNSSRFGKYIELSFNTRGHVIGGKISEYLLEKSRVVHQGRGECNFHIFYWMMGGLSPEEVNLYGLKDMAKFRYLQGTKVDAQPDNKAKFWKVKDCLHYIGFSQTDIQSMIQILSIVLHLGEIEFKGVGNNDAAQVINTDMLKVVSDMLEVSAKELGSALVADYTVTRGEQIKKERTVERARDCRDALAKMLYARLFSWIVNGINQLIQPVEEGSDLQIGILDIFGFENFPQNSFEQMCINVANEQIQLYTNENILYREQQDCLLEGVPLVDVTYNNNQAILDLFLERPTGLLAILDEESNFPKATDKSLASKLHTNVGKKHNRYYKTPRDSGLRFSIIHYAGCVTYDVAGILEKNRDTLPNSIMYTMKTSNLLLIKELFQSRVNRTGSLAPSARQQRTTIKKVASPFEFFKKLKGGNKEGKKAGKTVSVEKKGPSTMAYHFRNSLADLINKLQSAKPHFVRCIKPNTSKKPLTFVPDYVLAQLRYTGVGEIVKIRKYGYPLRLTFHHFLNRYPALVACSLPKFCPMQDRQKCEVVLQYYHFTGVQFGKTKVFFKLDHADRLDQLTFELELKVTRAQSVVRGFLARQKSKRLLNEREKQTEEERQLTLKKQEIENITKSLDTLDDIITEYETASSIQAATKKSPPPPPSSRPPPNMANPYLSVMTTKGHMGSKPHSDDGDHVYDDAVSTNIRRDLGGQGHPGSGSPVEEEEGFYDEAFIAETERDDGQANVVDMNSHIQQRGLPPTPTHHGHAGYEHRPPPTPREMYSGINEQHGDHRKHAPPPPKRNPDTRLSTSSVSSVTSQGMYEEIHGQPTSPSYHHDPNHQYYQQQQQYGNQSPRHMPNDPKDPGRATSQPFSYGAPGALMSPQLKHSERPVTVSDPNVPNYNQNGHGQFHGQAQQRPTHPSPTMGRKLQYADQGVVPGSPAMHYGKTESVFNPQPHRPPPHGPPPPVPGEMQGQQYMAAAVIKPKYPSPHGSPRTPRHSVPHVEMSQRQQSVQSPVLPQRLSQRSKSVPYNTEDVDLPAPPPLRPLDSYLGAAQQSARAPSPPLPPPPPELLENLPPPTNSNQISAHPSYVPQSVQPNMAAQQGFPMSYNQQQLPQQQQYIQQQQQQQQYYPEPSGPPPPPPPPVSSIPKKQTGQVPPAAKGSHSPGPNNVAVAAPGFAMGGNQPEQRRAVNSVAQSSREVSPMEGMLKEMNKVNLKRTEGEADGQEMMSAKDELSNFKLRQTTARIKLLEKDGLKPTTDDVPPPAQQAPPPPEAPPTTLATQPESQYVTPVRAPQEERDPEVVSPRQAVNLFKKMEDASKSSKDSSMEISLDNIDVTEIPGYIPITKSTPIWKRDMIEKKNQEKIEEYLEKKRKEKEEQEKWKNVPAWKRKLLMEKAKEDEQKSTVDQQKAAEEEANKKIRSKEAEEERKARIREQQEMERKMQEEMQDVPEWKREIMMKRGGAIKNWGDEREDENDQEREERERLEEAEAAAAYTPEPPKEPMQSAKTPSQISKSPTKISKTPNENMHVPPAQKIARQPENTDTQNAPAKTAAGHAPSHAPAQAPPPKRTSIDESKLEDEWDTLPAWKKEIMMKRGGAIRNWGDDREEVNEEDEEYNGN
ncbi:unconventional myosin-XVI-like isoform X3 [Mya arenaria]|nr:unconventional myosin-XVI-like isoform X3 [Mya arenaria]